jgi:hypothetical protein
VREAPHGHLLDTVVEDQRALRCLAGAGHQCLGPFLAVTPADLGPVRHGRVAAGLVHDLAGPVADQLAPGDPERGGQHAARPLPGEQGQVTGLPGEIGGIGRLGGLVGGHALARR